jgi:phosphotransferase system IIB component
LWETLPAGMLGQASAWGSGSHLTEADFSFNTLYVWNTAPTCPAGQYDVQFISTHELGHWLSLRDLYGNKAGYPQDTAKVMYGVGNAGETKRALHPHDILGIQYIYGTLPTAAQKLVGADDAATTTPVGGGYLVLDKFTAVAPGNVSQIRVKCTTSGNVKVALYADSAGNPGALLGVNNGGTDVVAGWNNIYLPSTPVIMGTNYWIAYISTTNCVGYFSSPGGGAVFRALSYSSDFPASAGTGFTTSAGNHSLIAGWGIAGAIPLAVTTTSLPDGTTGVAYSQTLQAIGGTGSYTWSLTSGSLPPDLTLTGSTGVIAGNPTTVGTYSFTAQVNDGSTTASQPLSITIAVPTQKLLGADDAAAIGAPANNYLILDKWAAVATGDVTRIRVKCTTTGNVKVALYTDNSGIPGTLISANNAGAAVVAGWNNITIPSTAVTTGTNYWIAYISTTNCVGYFSSPGGGAVFRALSYSTDFPASAGTGFTTSSGNHSLTAGWGISGPTPLTITTTSLLDGTVGVAYSQTLQAIGGTGSYTWSLSSGSLPDGLPPISSGGLISGTPTTVSTYSFTVQVNDGSTTATKPLSITITNYQKLLGADDAAAAGPVGNNFLVLDRWPAVLTANVTQIRVKCTTTGNVKVALYTDNSGSPGTLINANNTGAAVITGWNNITIPSTAVISGTNYWIAYNSTTNCVGYYSSPGGGAVFRALSYSTDFPALAGAGFTTSSGNHSLTAGWGQYTPPAPPSPPSLLSPGTAITFRWGTSSGATTYWLQVNTAADFTGTNMFNAEVGNITTQEVTGLSLGTTYFWRVKAGNSSGWSAWTGVRSVVSSTVP